MAVLSEKTFKGNLPAWLQCLSWKSTLPDCQQDEQLHSWSKGSPVAGGQQYHNFQPFYLVLFCDLHASCLSDVIFALPQMRLTASFSEISFSFFYREIASSTLAEFQL